MADPTEKNPAPKHASANQTGKDAGMYDPQDLVYKGGYTGNPREIVENPAVAPEMLDQVEDWHDDLLAEPEDMESGRPGL